MHRWRRLSAARPEILQGGRGPGGLEEGVHAVPDWGCRLRARDLLVAGHRPHPETRGSIEGVVKDTSGAVLPGVTVEARSPALVGVSTATTDAQGIYRFPALAPGVYEVSATLAGFSPRKVADTPGNDLHPAGSEVWSRGSVAESPHGAAAAEVRVLSYLILASKSFACATCGAAGGASVRYFSRSALASAFLPSFNRAKPR